MAGKLGKTASGIGGALVLMGLILYTGGFWQGGRIMPGEVAAPPAPAAAGPRGRAELVRLTDHAETVGTFRPRSEVRVEAQFSGRVLKVEVRPGEEVAAGQLLVMLDDREARVRLEQAREGLAGARAAQQRAESQYERVQRLIQGEAATPQDMERAREARLRAAAAVRQAEQQVEEAQIALGYAKVKAPEAGQVARRLVEPGDLALPGRPLVVLQSGQTLRLEALVREGLIQKVRLGQEIQVAVPALEREMTGRVEEIVPAADPQTRSFLVKLALPASPGLYPGMFGRLLLPVGESETVLAPARAILRVGQLAMVRVRQGEAWRRVYVTLGRHLADGRVEVLSGLAGGEELLLGEGGDV